MTDPLASSRRRSQCPLPGLLLALAANLPGHAAPQAATGTPPGPVRSAQETRAAAPYLEAQQLLRAGQAAAALVRLEAATPEQAREPRIRFLRGVLLAELGRPEEAANVYTGLTQDFPELADPYNNLAVLKAAQGRLDEARVALEAALRADPAHREARENLGDVYVRLALRLWEGLGPAPGRREADAELARKLRLAREIGTPAR